MTFWFHMGHEPPASWVYPSTPPPSCLLRQQLSGNKTKGHIWSQSLVSLFWAPVETWRFNMAVWMEEDLHPAKNTTILIFRWFHADENVLMSITFNFCHNLPVNPINPTHWFFKALFKNTPICASDSSFEEMKNKKKQKNNISVAFKGRDEFVCASCLFFLFHKSFSVWRWRAAVCQIKKTQPWS